MKTSMKLLSCSPILIALTLSATLSPIGASVNAQEAVFVVPKAQGEFDSGELTKTGKKKAEALSRVLKDAGIDVIYAIGRHGSRTAEPIATALNLKVNKIPRNTDAIDDWVRRLPTEHANQRVLFVTVGPGPMPGEGLRLLKGLGVPDQDIWSRRSDHLMVIIPNEGKEPLVIKTRW